MFPLKLNLYGLILSDTPACLSSGSLSSAEGACGIPVAAAAAARGGGAAAACDKFALVFFASSVDVRGQGAFQQQREPSAPALLNWFVFVFVLGVFFAIRQGRNPLQVAGDGNASEGNPDMPARYKVRREFFQHDPRNRTLVLHHPGKCRFVLFWSG